MESTDDIGLELILIKTVVLLIFYKCWRDYSAWNNSAETGPCYCGGTWVYYAFGLLTIAAGLCCCFDADATVRRRGADGLEELALLRDLSIGDSVLSVDPFTRRALWQPVLAKAHYSLLDGAQQLSPMRRLVLGANVSASLTLSHTHFIFARKGGTAAPERMLAQDVHVGDELL